jgi:hypothetical protein
MQTSKWGPSAWDYLHTLTFNYPEKPTDDNKKYYYELFNNLKFTLPCKYCRESYNIFFKYIDINNYLNDRMGITYWLYIIHNIVNYKLNKKTVDFIDVVNFYEKRRANQIDKNCKKLCICNELVCCCKKFCTCKQNNCNCKQNNCNCNQCNKNVDFVLLTKLKYNNITNNYIKKLIDCDELKI